MKNYFFTGFAIFFIILTGCNTEMPDEIKYTPETKSEKIAQYLKSASEKLKRGDDTGAIQDYTSAINLSPGNAQFYYMRGFAKMQLDQDIGNTEELPDADFLGSPKAIMRDVIDDEENNPDPYDSEGLGKYALGDNEGALRDFNRAIKLKGDYAEAYYQRGLLKRIMGDEKGATEDLLKASKLGYSE